jgi:hypothetical protein
MEGTDKQLISLVDPEQCNRGVAKSEMQAEEQEEEGTSGSAANCDSSPNWLRVQAAVRLENRLRHPTSSELPDNTY